MSEYPARISKIVHANTQMSKAKENLLSKRVSGGAIDCCCSWVVFRWGLVCVEGLAKVDDNDAFFQEKHWDREMSHLNGLDNFSWGVRPGC
jgi:hypothetical protein